MQTLEFFAQHNIKSPRSITLANSSPILLATTELQVNFLDDNGYDRKGKISSSKARVQCLIFHY